MARRNSRPPLGFTQRDLTRAVKGAQAAGMNIAEVVLLPSGEIRLLNGANRAHAEQRANDFDRDFN